jgi:CubicO group peptidase (beta-lactamase class C family)
MFSISRSTRRTPGVAVVAVLSALSACGGGRPADPSTATSAAPSGTPQSGPSAPTIEQLAADTTIKSASGATFEAPTRWFLTRRENLIALETPERDLTLTSLEVANEPDAARAIDSAWKRVDPKFNRTTKQAAHPPTTDGWDGLTQIVYEVGANELRSVIAIAKQKGTTQYVALIDGTNAAFERRGAQLMTALSTFKTAGVEEESLGGRAAHELDANRVKLLQAFVETSMAKTKIPGAAIAVVQDGKAVFEKGFGVREMGKKEPVTPSTLFMIGSTTKSLTTLMIAKLVDDKKLDWETPVTELLPSFGLGDAHTSGKVLLKHTACACTGMPRQDLEFIFEHASATPEMRIAAMKSMKPTTAFGETFQYSNSMVAAGGYAAGHVLEPKKDLGRAYDTAMQTRVFGPLGMKSTTLDIAVAERRDHASPHGENVRGELVPMKPSAEGFVVAVRPAGAAWSNTTDMTKYLMLELAKGRRETGGAYVSEANLLKRRQPQVKVTDKIAYGLGLFIESDHGVPIVHHGGNTLGFTSDLFVLPESGVGVVVLTNAANANAFRRGVRRRVLELLFDAKEDAEKVLAFALSTKQKAIEKEASKIGAMPDLAWAKGFVGTYKNDGLGLVTVRVDGSTLTLDAGEWKSRVGTTREGDGTWKLVLLDAPLPGLELVATATSGQKVLTLDDGQHRYTFELQGAPNAH